jgi:hypothetical protein
MLFVFAELCGYQIMTEPPEIPAWVEKSEDKRKEAVRLDWKTVWENYAVGWKVSCVLTTTYANLASYRYTIFIDMNGGIQILNREPFFCTHHII